MFVKRGMHHCSQCVETSHWSNPRQSAFLANQLKLHVNKQVPISFHSAGCESSSSPATSHLEITNHRNNMSVQLSLPPPPTLCPVQHVQEIKSNHQTSRKSNNVIFPARKRCHSSQPLGQGQFASVSEDLGTYLMPSVLDLMAADEGLDPDVGPAAAARSFIFSFRCLFISVFVYSMAVFFFDKRDFL